MLARPHLRIVGGAWSVSTTRDGMISWRFPSERAARRYAIDVMLARLARSPMPIPKDALPDGAPAPRTAAPVAPKAKAASRKRVTLKRRKASK